ncbi:hypothetical protein PPTG_23365 [Phytophthora nicotianae INRA-310]|uniref:Uncharacterized protein n=1 Tax=Phytophthora nicotianae (strain INRA-310) TaxID=761204 RepID=W2Q0J6_PHYN3|nr:hypothetical protein PPTG_23365 [Phytophthora nicotianae INRA-310]ETN06396.1 hypothetical protein PPTG_23365 [Phytophthora nicotianae INRA-310]
MELPDAPPVHGCGLLLSGNMRTSDRTSEEADYYEPFLPETRGRRRCISDYVIIREDYVIIGVDRHGAIIWIHDRPTRTTTVHQ